MTKRCFRPNLRKPTGEQAEDEQEDKEDADDEIGRRGTQLEVEEEAGVEDEGNVRRYTTWLSEARRRVMQEMGPRSD